MKFSAEKLTKLKQEIFAPAVIGARVPLQKDGAEYLGLCPFHEEKTPSFKIYRKEGIWLFHCFGCSETGNVFQFFQKVDKISFDAAVEKVIRLANWEEGKQTVEKVFALALETEKKIVTYPLDRLKGVENALAGSVGERWLADRGISLETAQSLHIGFIQSLRAVNPNHPWVDRGWVVFPTTEGNEITCIKYRSVIGKKTEDGKSGILRAPNMKTSLYALGAITAMDDAFLVEGEPDALIMAQAGYNAAAMPSAEYTLTPSERDKLVRANRIFLAGDMDTPGRTAMTKLWTEFQDRTYLIEWPDGCKDANDTFLKHCEGDGDKFQALVEKLKAKAVERPIADYYDMKESVRNADDTSPMENPRRLHFSNKDVDEMAVVLPGNVVSVFATYTGSGKTTWCLDSFELEEAMKHGSTVLNYSAELSPQEFAMLVASNLLMKDRLKLTRADFEEAASILDRVDAKFYVGYNPDLNRIGLVLDSLEWAIRRLGAHIVVLDHLHFLCRGESNEIKAQADAMQRIKNLAVKYQIIFVVVGQSRKEQPSRKSRPSEMSDAKGSESFSSDASTVYHIHRNLKRDINWDSPETWPKDMLDNITDIRMPKCRTKGPGKAVARQVFHGEFGKFFPYTTQEPMR